MPSPKPRYFPPAPPPDTRFLKHAGGPKRRLLETVHLRFNHYVATQEYGPGVVKVSPELAATLREGETRAALSEAKLRDPQPMATMIYPNGWTRKVNPDTFNPMGMP